MSHKAHIEVLAWHQPEDARSGTFVPADIAHDLIQRLAAEKLNSKKIRMFSPDSVYLAGRQLSPEYDDVLRALPLPPVEVGNCKFVPPAIERNPAIAQVRIENLFVASQGWDWSAETATA